MRKSFKLLCEPSSFSKDFSSFIWTSKTVFVGQNALYGNKTILQIRAVYFKSGRQGRPRQQFAMSYKAAYFQQVWTCCIPLKI